MSCVSAGNVGVLGIVDFAPGSRLAGVKNLMFGRWARVPGVKFFKVLGSGYEGGFGVRPSFSHQGLFAVFEDDAAADAWLAESEQLKLYREHSTSWLTLKLRAYASRGAWDGVQPLSVSVEKPAGGVIASLTRGSIRLARASTFWSHAPGAQEAIAASPDCLLAVGLGEAPLFRQCTFTVWKTDSAMDAWARSGAHLTAAQAALGGGHFSESLFARFVLSAVCGSWKGRSGESLLMDFPSP